MHMHHLAFQSTTLKAGSGLHADVEARRHLNISSLDSLQRVLHVLLSKPDRSLGAKGAVWFRDYARTSRRLIKNSS